MEVTFQLETLFEYYNNLLFQTFKKMERYLIRFFHSKNKMIGYQIEIATFEDDTLDELCALANMKQCILITSANGFLEK